MSMFNLKPEYIIIHHSATPDGNTYNTDAIRQYHIEVNGWADIGYHFLIEKVGDEYILLRGRHHTKIGAHCKDLDMNKKSLGVCLVGNFDILEPPQEQMIKTLYTVRGLQQHYGIDTTKVLGHREVQALAGIEESKRKTCPGKRFDMDKFRVCL